MLAVFALLIIYQIKHFLCDYPFQTDWMLGKFKPGLGWIVPLAAHAGVHGLATFLIVKLLWATSPAFALQLALFDFIVHFIMDRIKASPTLLGRFKPAEATVFVFYKQRLAESRNGNATPLQIVGRQVLRSNKLFWWALGFDQMIHHLTHYIIIYVLVH